MGSDEHKPMTDEEIARDREICESGKRAATVLNGTTGEYTEKEIGDAVLDDDNFAALSLTGWPRALAECERLRNVHKLAESICLQSALTGSDACLIADSVIRLSRVPELEADVERLSEEVDDLREDKSWLLGIFCDKHHPEGGDACYLCGVEKAEAVIAMMRDATWTDERMLSAREDVSGSHAERLTAASTASPTRGVVPMLSKREAEGLCALVYERLRDVDEEKHSEFYQFWGGIRDKLERIDDSGLADGSTNDACTCDGRGWDTRGRAKDQQWRVCASCWEKADDARREAIIKELGEYKAEQARLWFPSGRQA
jgi:hypothetical protein